MCNQSYKATTKIKISWDTNVEIFQSKQMFRFEWQTQISNVLKINLCQYTGMPFSMYVYVCAIDFFPHFIFGFDSQNVLKLASHLYRKPLLSQYKNRHVVLLFFWFGVALYTVIVASKYQQIVWHMSIPTRWVNAIIN